MDVNIPSVSNVITRVINEHGIIHGLKRFKNTEVKIVVIEPAGMPTGEDPGPEMSTVSPVRTPAMASATDPAPNGEEPSGGGGDQYYDEPEPEKPYSSEPGILVSTTDLIRGYIKT
jgi:hypothetical protein